MAHFSITSTNPDLSFCLAKNPASGMKLKSLRKGVVFGWYEPKDTYHVLFQDAPDEISFPIGLDDEFEYLDKTRYSSSLAIVGMIDSFFNSLVKKVVSQDTLGFSHTVTITSLAINREHYLTFFKTHFPKLKITFTPIFDCQYKVVCSTKSSLQYLLRVVSLFTMFVAMTNREQIYISPAITRKYLALINWVDAPYFIRYLFKLHFLRSRKLFEEFKQELESSKRYQLEFIPEGNHKARRGFVRKYLQLNKTIVDVGCGEGFFTLYFARQLKLTEKTHHLAAIDTDPTMRELLHSRMIKRELDNIQLFDSWKEFIDSSLAQQPYEAILSEVIEHMSLEQATDLVGQILDQGLCHLLLITTPNKDFNRHYFHENEQKRRHEEHVFEMTKDEFTAWIDNLLGSRSNYEHEAISYIGDKVDGIGSTFGVCIKKKQQHQNS